MRASLPLAVLDYEASSLSDNSYPIEIGWALVGADFAISSGSLLIRPHRDWTDWSVKSQAIHGLPRDMLEGEGASVIAAAAALDATFAELPGPDLSADPEYEAFWSDRLYSAAGTQRAWAIGSLHRAVEAELAILQPQDRYWAAAAFAVPRPHRAEADARAFAAVIAQLVRRNS